MAQSSVTVEYTYCIPAAFSLLISVLTFLFLQHLPRVKETTKPCFSPLSSSLLHSPFPSLLLTGLSLPISPHLHLFFLPQTLRLSYFISFHLFLCSHPAPSSPHTNPKPCHSKQEAWQYICLGQTRIHSQVINNFFSCYSPHIFYSPPHHPSSSFSPCLLFFHLASFPQSITHSLKSR